MENEAENELHFNILISPIFGQIGLGHSPPIEPESSQGSSVKANIIGFIVIVEGKRVSMQEVFE